MPRPDHAAPPRFVLGMALLWGSGLGAVACTLSDDFEPRAIDASQQVVATTGTGGSGTDGSGTDGSGTGGAGNLTAGCSDPRGCCTGSDECDAGEACVAGVCQEQAACTSVDEVSVCPLELCPGPSCPTDSCSDDLQNGDETGIDCGGSCPDACMTPAATPTCNDQLRNQDETAVDCGGSCATKCSLGQGCDVDDDCSEPLLCSPSSRVCTAVSCADSQQNGNEILVDCGGGTCPGCPIGTACVSAADCSSNACERGVCISCQDNARNGGETDVDCGGANQGCQRCALNQDCALDRDCQSGNCDAGVCVSFSCSDNQQNGNETGVDCGGNGAGCGPCPDGSGCRGAADCENGLCSGNVCVSCDDDTRNGNETDIDCGGASGCARCAPGLACAADGDCASGACVGGRCCGGNQGDCTRCAERLSPNIDCDAPQAGQDSTGVANCRAFLQCLASNPATCSTRNALGCSGDNQASDACPHNDYGGNAGTGLTRANQVLQNAGCQL